jgi:hypothetical protein
LAFHDAGPGDIVRLIIRNRHRLRPPSGRAVGERGNPAYRGDIIMRLTPPTSLTFTISVLLAVLAIVGQFAHMVSNYIPISMFWLAIVAYIVLFLGNVVRGF